MSNDVLEIIARYCPKLSQHLNTNKLAMETLLADLATMNSQRVAATIETYVTDYLREPSWRQIKARVAQAEEVHDDPAPVRSRPSRCTLCFDVDRQTVRHYHFLTADSMDALRQHMRAQGEKDHVIQMNCEWYQSTRELYRDCVDTHGQPLNLADAWIMAQYKKDIKPGSASMNGGRKPAYPEYAITHDIIPF